MDINEIKQRMHTGKVYLSNDDALVKEQLKRLDMVYDLNHTKPSQIKKREALQKEMFAEFGEDCYIESPFYANWGGKHVHFGNHIYVNFNLTCVDDTHIYLGDYVMIGPNVILCAATHPLHPELRKEKGQYNLPIYIEKNVWIGGGVFVMPGVRIGENSVIGANSIVTSDIPENVIAVGSPCRVLRALNEDDKRFYHKDQLLDI